MPDPLTTNPTVFTSLGDLTLQQLQSQSFGTATAVAGAATSNAFSGRVTTEVLTTAAGADYTLTLTNSNITPADIVLANVGRGTDTAGTPTVAAVTPGSGVVAIVVQNIHATAALNGTLVIAYQVIKA